MARLASENLERDIENLEIETGLTIEIDRTHTPIRVEIATPFAEIAGNVVQSERLKKLADAYGLREHPIRYRVGEGYEEVIDLHDFTTRLGLVQSHSAETTAKTKDTTTPDPNPPRSTGNSEPNCGRSTAGSHTRNFVPASRRETTRSLRAGHQQMSAL